MKSVTLNGDIYDPNGKLHGGATPSNNGILLLLQKRHYVIEELRKAREELKQLQNKQEKLEKVRSSWEEYQGKMQLILHKLNALDERIAQSVYQQVIVTQLKSITARFYIVFIDR
jgi:structural maintenance of chromosome 2